MINTLKEYDILVNITLYKPERYQTITNFLSKYNIRYIIHYKEYAETDNDHPQFFNKFFTIEEIEGNKDLLYCESKFNCCQLQNQKLYVCQYMAYLHYLINTFKNDIDKQIGYDSSNKYLDLTQVKDYQELVDYVENYNEDICQHCLDKWTDVDFSNRIIKRLQYWRTSDKQVDEWIIDSVKKL